jgi:hypothetical protein
MLPQRAQSRFIKLASLQVDDSVYVRLLTQAYREECHLLSPGDLSLTRMDFATPYMSSFRSVVSC